MRRSSFVPQSVSALLGPMVLGLTVLAGCGSDSPATPAVLDPSSLVVTVANGEVGLATEFVVSARDTDGDPWTGGLALTGEVAGTNLGAAVTTAELGGGDYAVRYTPAALGLDTVTVLNDGGPVAGSPVASRVRIVFRAGTGSPAVDGTLSPGEWSAAEVYDVFSGPLVGATVQFLTDATDLYVAFRVPEPDDDNPSSAEIRFDNLVDLVINADDRISTNRTTFYDGFFGPGGIQPDAVAHGAGALVVSGGFAVAEMRHPHLRRTDPAVARSPPCADR